MRRIRKEFEAQVERQPEMIIADGRQCYYCKMVCQNEGTATWHLLGH